MTTDEVYDAEPAAANLDDFNDEPSSNIIPFKRVPEYVEIFPFSTNPKFPIFHAFLSFCFASVLKLFPLPWYEPTPDVKEVCICSFQAPLPNVEAVLPHNHAYNMIK